MGLWLEVKEKVTCLDEYCVARAVVESTLEKIGININTQVEKMIEEHVEKLISNGRHFDDPYTFYMESLKISVYDMNYDIVECHLEGCEGYVTASVELEADAETLKQIVKKLLRDIGADNIKICE